MTQLAIDALTQKGWLYEARGKMNALALPKRYQSVPAELKDFTSSFQTLRNKSDTMWFLSSANYNEKNADGFNWNEFELMSLSAAKDDAEWTKSVVSFWSQHLPVFMSVQGSYRYVAYCIGGPNNGKYVLGEEPEFEEVSAIDSSIGQAVEWLTTNGLIDDTNA